MKRDLGLPKNVRVSIRLQNELKSWEQRLHSLRLAIKYKEANTAEEMESKIGKGCGHAQKVAKELLPYYQEQAKANFAYNDYDYEYTTYLNDDLYGTSPSDSQEEAQDEKKDGESTAPDYMVTMLKALAIDPDVLHYSAELGDFTL